MIVVDASFMVDVLVGEAATVAMIERLDDDVHVHGALVEVQGNPLS